MARLWYSPAETATARWPAKASTFFLPLLLPVAVAQLAVVSIAPAPDSAVGGDGEAVRPPSRHSDDALASKGLDLLG